MQKEEEVTFGLFPEQVRLMMRVQHGLADPKEIMDVLQQIKEGLITEMKKYKQLEKHEGFKESVRAQMMELKQVDREDELVCEAVFA